MLVNQVLLVRQGNLDKEVILVLLDCLDHLDREGIQDLKVSKVLQDLQVMPVMLDHLEIQDLVEPLDNPAHLDRLEIRDSLELLDNLDSKGSRALLELREQVEHLEMEYRDRLE